MHIDDYDLRKFGFIKFFYYICNRKQKGLKTKTMFYIYEKNLNTNNIKVFMKVYDCNIAKHKVMEMNEESLYDDKFYFIKEADQS